MNVFTSRASSATWSRAGTSYVLYDEGRDREWLIDLVSDPGEMGNSIADPKLQDILEGHHDWLASGRPGDQEC